MRHKSFIMTSSGEKQHMCICSNFHIHPAYKVKSRMRGEEKGGGRKKVPKFKDEKNGGDFYFLSLSSILPKVRILA